MRYDELPINENSTKKSWIRKYFMEGQALSESTSKKAPPGTDLVEKILIEKRKYIAVALPILIYMCFWTTTAYRFHWFSLYPTHWQLPLVMILGASVAGMTAESAGAVVFPVLTLAMHTSPEKARDFALVVEANGLLVCMSTVLLMKVQIEVKAIIFGTIGSTLGLLVGFEYLDNLLSGPEKKMLFVSIWTAFAAALFLLNREKKRQTFMSIPEFSLWKAEVIIICGFVGGILTAFTGSGTDICVFSVITILFRVSEKSATPTTIMLMGLNSLVAAYYRLVWVGDVDPDILNSAKVSIPVAVLMCPLASFIGSHFHRQVLASFVYILEALAILGFLATSPPWHLVILTFIIIGIGFMFFFYLSKAGARLL